MSIAKHNAKRLILGALAAVLLLPVLASSASADIAFGRSGPGAGQTTIPTALAVDHSNGNVFVADSGNNRIDVFSAAGAFIRAFGWGVSDGNAEAQVCSITCFQGFRGGGAGEFEHLANIAIDNDPLSASFHDVYAFENGRVDKFTPEGAFLAAWGAGVISGGAQGTGDLTTTAPATGSGDLTFESTEIKNVNTSTGTFVVGQDIFGSGITAGTRITSVGNGTLVLSEGARASISAVALKASSNDVTEVMTTKKAFQVGQTIVSAGKLSPDTKILALSEGVMTLSKPPISAGTNVELSVAEGAGNTPVNEKQVLTIGPEASYQLAFQTPKPSPTEATTGTLTAAASPAAIQAALVGLSNVNPGDISVSGPAGGPYTIEYLGRYADTHFNAFYGLFTVSADNASLTTTQEGHSAPEVCTAANAAGCVEGVEGSGEGQFAFSGSALAVGSDGTVYVADENRVQEFNPSGILAEQLALPGAGRAGGGLAVDSTGAIYLASDNASGAVRKYDALGNLLDTLNPSSNIHAIAIDSAGDLFVADGDLGRDGIAEYDPSGVESRVFYGNGNIVDRPVGLAPYVDGTGDIFALEEGSEFEGGRVVHVAFPPAGPIVFGSSSSAVGNIGATLNAELNSEGASTTVHFQYVDDAHFKSEGGFASAATKTTAESAPVGADFNVRTAKVVIACAALGGASCLSPETTYHFRAIATNADGVSTSPEATLETLPPIQLGDASATDVNFDTANLHASLNPLGIAATGYLQYVDDATYQADVESAGAGHGFDHATDIPDVAGGASPFSFGSGEAQVAKSASLGSLTDDTTYHYRYVAADFFGTFTSVEHTFTTLSPSLPHPSNASCPNADVRVGASAGLPDCRAYEMVSPVDKDGGDVFFKEDDLEQGSSDGERITYSSARSFDDPNSAPLLNQYLSHRDPIGGWSTEAISTPQEGPSLWVEPGHTHFTDLGLFSHYLGFTEDLCSGWVVQGTEPTLSENAPPGYPNLYRRENCGPAVPGFEAMNPVKPNVIPADFAPIFEGSSADGTSAVFHAFGKLTEDAASTNNLQVYIAHDGRVSLVSMLPNGTPSKENNSAGNEQGDEDSNLKNAMERSVSADGSRVFWSDGRNGSPALYVRLNATQEPTATGQCSEAEPDKACTVAISEANNSKFWTAAADGSKVIYSVGADATVQLREFDVDTRSSRPIAGEIENGMGASEDADRVYFASREVLSGEQANSEGEQAQAGKFNLYLYEAGKEGAEQTYTFIKTLPRPPFAEADEPGLSFLTSRVSPDGLHAVFPSAVRLTGYDNTDANSGEADEELFVYDAVTEKLSCVSCDPSGARPVGRNTALGGHPEWVAASVPQWNEHGHASRALSDDGKKLFFDSFGALTPGDTNEAEDAYEWESADSQQACEAAGAEVYVKAAEGCLSLISSGTSSVDSSFVDASADGRDVFIKTVSSLLPSDPGLLDVYDARAGGGFPAPRGQAAECEGEACQAPAAPVIDATPGSLTFSGPGNAPSQPAAPVKPEVKAPTRAQMLAKALKACSKKPKKKRAGCRAHARKKYATKAKKATNNRRAPR